MCACYQMTAASWCFPSVCEENLDKVSTTSRFILKQLDYLLSISMRDSSLRHRQLSRVEFFLILIF